MKPRGAIIIAAVILVSAILAIAACVDVGNYLESGGKGGGTCDLPTGKYTEVQQPDITHDSCVDAGIEFSLNKLYRSDDGYIILFDGTYNISGAGGGDDTAGSSPSQYFLMYDGKGQDSCFTKLTGENSFKAWTQFEECPTALKFSVMDGADAKANQVCYVNVEFQVTCASDDDAGTGDDDVDDDAADDAGDDDTAGDDTADDDFFDDDVDDDTVN